MPNFGVAPKRCVTAIFWPVVPYRTALVCNNLKLSGKQCQIESESAGRLMSTNGQLRTICGFEKREIIVRPKTLSAYRTYLILHRGRDRGLFRPGCGAAREVYLTYRNEPQNRPGRKKPGPEGLRRQRTWGHQLLAVFLPGKNW